MEHKEKLEKYFQTFSNQDLDGLSEMFSDDVILVDWDINASGKEEVLEANKKIFQSVETINVVPYFYYVGEEAYAVEIDVIVNAGKESEETIQVVDIISFNEEGLIQSIEAYKR
jgi:ketosteroid isomerase-like protein